MLLALLCAPLGAARALPALPGDQVALERALGAIDAGRIQSDVEFLAADELGGRDSPSPGLRIAARFIRSRLLRLGWQPGAREGYFHTYPLYCPRIDEQDTWAAIGRPEAEEGTAASAVRRLVFGRDYFFHPGELATRELAGRVVYCGRGSQEELAAADVRGRWGLCLDGDLHWRRREKYAEDAGALGLLVLPGPDYDDDPYPERFRHYVRRALQAEPSPPSNAADAAGGLSQLFLEPTSACELSPELCPERVGALVLGQELDWTFTERRALAGGDGLIELENVAGWWPGSDPELARQAIVLTAHYDHVGEDSSGEIYNGADDNASGTAALMALAEALAEYGPLRRSVLLLWVSAEEKGLLGSEAWTLDPWLPGEARAVCNINIDMVGRNAPDALYITPTREHRAYNGLTRLAERWAASEGFGALGSADDYWQRSDHANFEQHLGIPVTFLFAEVHEDYHQPTDTADKIDSDKIRRVTRLVLRMLDGLQGDELGV